MGSWELIVSVVVWRNKTHERGFDSQSTTGYEARMFWKTSVQGEIPCHHHRDDKPFLQMDENLSHQNKGSKYFTSSVARSETPGGRHVGHHHRTSVL